MKKFGTDPKVKKTLVRNYEQKSSSQRSNLHKHYVEATSSNISHKKSTQIKPTDKNDNALSQPTLCSSEMLANYLEDVTKNIPLALPIKDQNIDKEQIYSKMTKKLNFHINEKLYKNLVELNASVDVQKARKDRKPSKPSLKKDLEPKIEDFFCDEKEKDMMPSIPIPGPKFKPVKHIENGRLHTLVATFEKL